MIWNKQGKGGSYSGNPGELNCANSAFFLLRSVVRQAMLAI